MVDIVVVMWGILIILMIILITVMLIKRKQNRMFGNRQQERAPVSNVGVKGVVKSLRQSMGSFVVAEIMFRGKDNLKLGEEVNISARRGEPAMTSGPVARQIPIIPKSQATSLSELAEFVDSQRSDVVESLASKPKRVDGRRPQQISDDEEVPDIMKNTIPNPEWREVVCSACGKKKTTPWQPSEPGEKYTCSDCKKKGGYYRK